jgi:hypothetical protein
MANGVVVLYVSQFDKSLQWHHKVVLDAVARAIAKIKRYDFGGQYDARRDYSRPLFFVPGDTLLVEETADLGIHSSNDLYGGVVPHLFMKTKAITHGLINRHAERPLGWSPVFAERVREIVLPGYTIFSNRNAQLAARRMLRRGPIRVKKPLSASGKDQAVITSLNELEAVLETVSADEMAAYGLVLEENLRQVRTFSVGEVAVGSLRISYYGTQRTVSDNEGRPVYGGSDLVCVRGGWESLDALPMSSEVRAAVVAARLYDGATEEFAGFMASTMMSLRESPLTVGPDRECLSLRGALEARAAPNSRQWQRSRGIRHYRLFAPPMSRNTAKAAELPRMRSSISRGTTLRLVPSSDTRP